MDEIAPWLSYLNCDTVNNIPSHGAVIHNCPDGEAVSYQEAIEAVWQAVFDVRISDPSIPAGVVDWMIHVGLPVWPVEEFVYSITPGII